MSRLLRVAFPVIVAAGALVVVACPAQAVSGQTSSAVAAPAKGQTRVKGDTKAECQAKGAKVVRKKQSEGYIVTFVGCSYDGLDDPPWTGTVFWHK